MFDKTITPAYETIGKRRKLTGFIGALLDGDTVIHSMEYSTNSQAEHALNTLTHELLSSDDDVPADAPGDDCDDHGPYADDDCPKCSIGMCIQNATHNVNGVHCCCFHYSEELTGVLCGCTDDDYGDAMAEQAMGSYNGNTSGDWLDVEGMRVVAPTSGLVVVQIATDQDVQCDICDNARVIRGLGNEIPCPYCSAHAPESLREDCLNVITMALGQTHGTASVVTELRRLKARLEAAAAA